MQRDICIRELISRDQFWWKTINSPWKLNVMHDWAPQIEDEELGRKVDPYKVSHWRDRALTLCEYEQTHKFFGLSFVDLMHLDPATFEEIEARVVKMYMDEVKVQEDSLKKMDQSKRNLLKGALK